MADAIVVGGGVIGLSIALELAEQGCDVALIEQGVCGREASWAGAGILPPGVPDGAATAADRLRAASHVLWAPLTARLRDATGIDNGYERCGGVEIRSLGDADAVAMEASAWRREGVVVESLTARDFDARFPHLHSVGRVGYFLPDLCQVRNPRHLKALRTACTMRGVTIREGEPVVEIEIAAGCATGVRTASDRHAAGAVCVAGGAWSQRLLADAGVAIDVEPVRGQIVLLDALPRPFPHVVQQGARYVVPRPDGRTLIGSTEERVGFDRRNTATAIRDLIEFAEGLLPQLAHATFERAWAGLRPGCGRDVPYLGPVPEVERLFVAAGHFRSGLQMSPITARLLREAILDQPSTLPLEPYGVAGQSGRLAPRVGR